MAIREDLAGTVEEVEDLGPFISIYMAVSPYEADKTSDKIKLKDLIALAKKIYLEAYPDQPWQVYEEQFNRVVETDSLGNNSEKSIGLVVDKEHLYQYYLPITVENQALVQDNLYLLPLIKANQYQIDYDILHLNMNNFELFTVNHGLCQPVELSADAPITSMDPTRQDEKELRDEQQGYFEAVDLYINNRFSSHTHHPLVLMGAKEVQGHFRKVAKNPQLVDIIAINKDIPTDNKHDFQAEIDTLNNAFKELEDTITVTKYNQAVSAKRTVEDLTEIARMAAQGLIGTMLILDQPIGTSDDSAKVTANQTEQENLLNDVAAQVMKYDGEVFMLPAGSINSKAAVIGIVRSHTLTNQAE